MIDEANGSRTAAEVGEAHMPGWRALPPEHGPAEPIQSDSGGESIEELLAMYGSEDIEVSEADMAPHRDGQLEMVVMEKDGRTHILLIADGTVVGEQG